MSLGPPPKAHKYVYNNFKHHPTTKNPHRDVETYYTLSIVLDVPEVEHSFE